MSSEARTRRYRPIATQNPNLPHWVMVHDLGADGRVPRFHFNLTPAAAEELADELRYAAEQARSEVQVRS